MRKGYSDRDDDVRSTVADRPPHIHDVLEQVAAVSLGSRKHHDMVPGSAAEIARWWPKQQEQPHAAYDKPVKQSKKDGVGHFWRTPYHDRLATTLRIFLGIDPDFQGLILAAREDDIFWRGDSREFFMSVIANTSAMQRDGVQAYRETAKQKIRESLAKFMVKQKGGKV